MTLTPKQKAKNLVDCYYMTMAYPDMSVWGRQMALKQAKVCALIAVELSFEVIEDCSILAGHPIQYYQEVKEEIIAY